MDEYKIIIEGYAYSEDNYYVASPSTVLIESNGITVLVDPGADPELLKKLKNAGYQLEDIDVIYLSHYHPDHFLNIRFFPNHKIYDGETIWDRDKEYETGDKIHTTNIKILKTPGHSPEHTSLLINTKDHGKVCIAQDVFWWEDGKQNNESEKNLMELEDPFASDIDELKKSRKKVLEVADWIIPGHGKMFKKPLKKS